jgi:hypothetical protein
VADGREKQRAAGRGGQECAREHDGDETIGTREASPCTQARTCDELGSELIGTLGKSRRAIDNGHAVL